jgi:hypothetical protein
MISRGKKFPNRKSRAALGVIFAIHPLLYPSLLILHSQGSVILPIVQALECDEFFPQAVSNLKTKMKRKSTL